METPCTFVMGKVDGEVKSVRRRRGPSAYAFSEPGGRGKIILVQVPRDVKIAE